MSLLTKLTAYGKRFQGQGGVKHLDTTRDWLLLLALFLAALIASVVWNAEFFFEVVEQEPANQTVPTEVTSDTGSVEKAQTLFEVRAAEEARYRSEYRFIDPSR